MTSGFRQFTDLRIAYSTSDDPLNTFYIPVLSAAKRVDRSAGYFTARGLAIIAQGLAHFIANGGTMRLLVGATLNEADVEAIEAGADLAEVTQREADRAVSRSRPMKSSAGASKRWHGWSPLARSTSKSASHVISRPACHFRRPALPATST